jgi:CheY-like chemotaxis protein
VLEFAFPLGILLHNFGNKKQGCLGSGNPAPPPPCVRAQFSTPSRGEAVVKTILFVDDHQVLARLSCKILEMHGYRAVSAYDGLDALRKFDEEEVDLMVTDYRMEGMNGVELARIVHQKHPEVPVILVTGYSDVEYGEDIAACLQKEALFPALLEKIQLFLSEREAVSTQEPASL